MIDSSDDENAAPKQAASSPASATANGGGSAAASPAARGKPAAAAAALFSEDDDEGGANDDASDVKKSSPSSQGPAGGSKPSSAKPPKAPKPKAVKAPDVAPGKKAKKAPVAAAKETGDGPASSPGSSSSGAKKRPSEVAGSGEKAKKKKKTGAEAAAGGGKKTAGSGSASKPPLPKKKLPTVPAEVEKDIRKAARMEVGRRKNDARSKVVSSFKRESALYAPPAAEAPASMEEDVPMVPPPEPAPSVLSALGPEQRSRLVACCNFLYTFARPLGLLYVPSLEKLAEALRTLDEPSGAGSAASTGGGDEGSEGEENEARAEAERLLEDLCLALVRAMAPDLEKTLGLHTGGNESALEHVSIGRGASGTKGGAGSGLVLPLNKLTWREVARLSLTTFVLDNVGLDGTFVLGGTSGWWCRGVDWLMGIGVAPAHESIAIPALTDHHTPLHPPTPTHARRRTHPRGAARPEPLPQEPAGPEAPQDAPRAPLQAGRPRRARQRRQDLHERQRRRRR